MTNDLISGPFHLDGVDNLNAAYENIFGVFRRLEPELDDALFEKIKASSRLVKFKRGEVILDYGQVCRDIYFVVDGLVRSSFILDRGEKPMWYITTGEILIAVESFYTQLPSEEKLMALKSTTCVAMPKVVLDDLYHTHARFNIVGRKMTEKYYRQAMERTKGLHETPAARYEKMMRDYSNIVKQLSVREMANYLGIARETLSRLRRRLSRSRKGSGKR